MKKLLLVWYLLCLTFLLFGFWRGITHVRLLDEVSLVTVFTHPLWLRVGLGLMLIVLTGAVLGRQLIKVIKGKKLTIFTGFKNGCVWLLPVLLVLVFTGMLNWYVAVDMRLAKITAGAGPLLVKEVTLTSNEDGACFESIQRKGNRLVVNGEVFILRVLPLPVNTSYMSMLEQMICH